MTARSRITRDAILAEARSIIAEEGVAAATYQALADRLHVSKQAIIYWFPSKIDIARELLLAALKEEAAAAAGAVAGAPTAAAIIERFLRAFVAHHLADLGRFRLIYAVGQIDRDAPDLGSASTLSEPVHRTTSLLYGTLEAALAAAPDFARPAEARRVANAVHMAGVGLVTMVSLAAAVNDPLAHPTETLLDALVDLCVGRVLGPRS